MCFQESNIRRRIPSRVSATFSGKPQYRSFARETSMKHQGAILTLSMLLACVSLPANACASSRPRQKTRSGFKQSFHRLGTDLCQFCMKEMHCVRRQIGDQYLNRRAHCRQIIRQKMAAYLRYIRLDSLVRGLLQCLSVVLGKKAWFRLSTWLRTRSIHMMSSDMVFAPTLRTLLPKCVGLIRRIHDVVKFVIENTDLIRLPG